MNLFVPLFFRLLINRLKPNVDSSWWRLRALLETHKESRLILTSALHSYTAAVASDWHLKHPNSMSKNVALPNSNKPTRGADIKIVMKVPTKLLCLSTVNPNIFRHLHTQPILRLHLYGFAVILYLLILNIIPGGRRHFKAPDNFKRPKGWGYLQVSRVDTKAATNSESRHWRGCSFLCVNVYIYTRQDATLYRASRDPQKSQD